MYNKPEFEIVELKEEDVIATSLILEDEWDAGDPGGDEFWG